jgi:heterodisulfide reductase subunit C
MTFKDIMMIRPIRPKKIDPSYATEVRKVTEGRIDSCFQCGSCVGSCPAGASSQYRIRKIIWKISLGMKEEVLREGDIWRCTTCFTCYERCPRGVKPTELVIALRNMAIREGIFPESFKKSLLNLESTGQVVPLTEKIRRFRKELGLTEDSPFMRSSAALKEVQSILKDTGIIDILEAYK